MRNEECAGMSWNAHPKIVLRGWIVWKTTTQINTAEDWLLQLCKQWLNDLIIHSLNGEGYRFEHITIQWKYIFIPSVIKNYTTSRSSTETASSPHYAWSKGLWVQWSKGPWTLFFERITDQDTPLWGSSFSSGTCESWSWKMRAVFLAFGIKSLLKRKQSLQLDSRFEELTWILQDLTRLDVIPLEIAPNILINSSYKSQSQKFPSHQ